MLILVHTVLLSVIPFMPSSEASRSLQKWQLQMISFHITLWLEYVKYEYALSITKHYNIDIYISSIAQSAWSNTEDQLFQYLSARKVNAGVLMENVCIVTRVKKYN